MEQSPDSTDAVRGILPYSEHLHYVAANRKMAFAEQTLSRTEEGELFTICQAPVIQTRQTVCSYTIKSCHFNQYIIRRIRGSNFIRRNNRFRESGSFCDLDLSQFLLLL